MGSFSNPEMQSWMPFILGGKKSMTDKLILMQYLQMAENQGKNFCNDTGSKLNFQVSRE